AGCADFVLSVSENGDELMRVSRHPNLTAGRPAHVFDDDTRERLFVLLRSAFGVGFGTYKQTTIDRRLQRRMGLHRLPKLEDLLGLVGSKAADLNALYKDLLIGVTAFFRDKEPFEALEALVFPRLLDNRDPKLPIRAWVPGCSTGEEAYSIAIALFEHLGDHP